MGSTQNDVVYSGGVTATAVAAGLTGSSGCSRRGGQRLNFAMRIGMGLRRGIVGSGAFFRSRRGRENRAAPPWMRVGFLM